jgi:hypothetical protein
MVIASEPGWLRAAGQAAGTILLLELFIALFVLLALMGGLAFGAWWVRHKVVPILQEYTPKAEQAMTVAQQGTEKVVNGVAEFYGRRQQVETSLRVLLFGNKAAERVHEDALAQAAEDLQLMSPAEAGPGPSNGWTPQPRNHRAERTPVALDGSGQQPRGRLPAPSAPASERSASAGAPGATGTGGAVTWRPRYNTEDGRPGGNDGGDFGNMASNAG